MTPRERQRQRKWIQQVLAKAKQKAESARDAASKAISALVDLGPGFYESFTKSASQPSTRAREVKAAQAEARATFRQLRPVWQAAQRAQDEWSRVAASRKRLTLRATSMISARAAAEATNRETERQAELSLGDQRAKQEAYDAQARLLSEAQMTKEKAELEERNWRARREELKTEGQEASEARKPARIAERQALAERQAVQHECSKVERSQQRMEEAKSSAIKRLQSEVYDAGQVEQAYEQRRRALVGES